MKKNTCMICDNWYNIPNLNKTNNYKNFRSTKEILKKDDEKKNKNKMMSS